MEAREFVSKFYRQSVDSLTRNYETPFRLRPTVLFPFASHCHFPPTLLRRSRTLDRPFSTYLMLPLSRERPTLSNLPSTLSTLSAMLMPLDYHTAERHKTNRRKISFHPRLPFAIAADDWTRRIEWSPRCLDRHAVRATFSCYSQPKLPVVGLSFARQTRRIPQFHGDGSAVGRAVISMVAINRD